MRKSWIAKVGVAGLVLAGASVAGAQTNGPSGITARLGLFMPTAQFARNIGTNWFSVGVDYKLNTASVSAPTEDTLAYVGISADYYEKGGSSALPVALTYNIRSGQIVWHAGVGMDFVRLGVNTSGLAAQVGAAYEFGQGTTPVLVQAKYFFSSKTDLNGFGLYFGVRF